MRLWAWLPIGAVLVLCVSCGKKGQERSPWPAVVVKISDVSETETASIRSGINRLNEKLGGSVVAEEGPYHHYVITIRKVAINNDKRDRAGLAVFDHESCEVQLSEAVFIGNPALLEPVLWHELGHCAGLPHDPTKGEMMYHSTSVDGRYSAEAIQRFLKAFASSVGISVK